MMDALRKMGYLTQLQLPTYNTPDIQCPGFRAFFRRRADREGLHSFEIISFFSFLLFLSSWGADIRGWKSRLERSENENQKNLGLFGFIT